MPAEVEISDPGPGFARIRLERIGVNFIDTYHRTGLYPLPLPFVPGVEAAGVVESIGRTNATAGMAVVVAGGTVVVAILGLRMAGIPFVAALFR